MKTIYLVGGAVRDKLLGIPHHDRDWVVVGSTKEEMLRQGYKQVRNQYPVFIHPETHEEYALARTENKNDLDSNNFIFNTSPDISLEKDLQRRDLTINAIAQSEDGKIIDPFHGREDLKNKKLCHISNHFIEDPIRLLRISRFMAKFCHLGFSIAESTFNLLKIMAQELRIGSICPDLIWKETKYALQERNPEKFFETLADCDALTKLLPQLNITRSSISTLAETAKLTEDPVIRFTAFICSALNLNIDNTQTIKRLCDYFNLPFEYKNLITLVAKHGICLINENKPSAQHILSLLTDFHLLDNNFPLFNPDQTNIFKQFLTTCHMLAETRVKKINESWLIDCLRQAKMQNSQDLYKQGFKSKILREKLRENRLHIIQTCLDNNDSATNFSISKPLSVKI